MKVGLFALLAITLFGCSTARYEPRLVQLPSDTIKYEEDLTYCHQEQEKRSEIASKENVGNSTVISAFGLLGYAAVSANASPEDDYFKTPGKMIDECMEAKGYRLLKQ